MKITVIQLRKIIKEEVSKVLKESQSRDLGFLHKLPVFRKLKKIAPDYADYTEHQARLVPSSTNPGMFHMETEDPYYGGWEPLLDDSGAELLFNADGSIAM